MTPPKTVDDAAKLIRERLTELDAERRQLERALTSLVGRGRRRGPGRPRGRAATTTAARRTRAPRQRRSRRGGTRAEQAVKLIQENPGITASEIAKKMSIKPNYLYRVLGDLQQEGKVKKEGRAYHPA